MAKKLKMTAGIFTVIFCILLGCQRREEGRQELLLPAEGEGLSSGEAGREDVITGRAVTEDDKGAALRTADAGTEDTGLKEAGQASLEETTCTVHICGAVNNPGVYVMEGESRIYQAVEKAGGFREDAHEDYLNQADLLRDGMKVYVPTIEEVEEGKGLLAASAPEEGTYGQATEGASSLVNINTAGEELLCTLNGVGSSRAKSIIAYREKNGAFQKIEDIMKVEGIKDGLFQKIKDSITV